MCNFLEVFLILFATHTTVGDMPQWGKGPVQGKIHNNPDYIPNEFPLLDKFEKCTVIIHKPSEDAMTADGEEDDKDPSEEGGDDEGDDEGGEDAGTRDDGEAEEEEHEHRRHPRPVMTTDDPIETEQRELKAAQKILGPFEDFLQLGIVVGAIIALVLCVAAISRKSRKKKHAH